jgi:hypothetical protein
VKNGPSHGSINNSCPSLGDQLTPSSPLDHLCRNGKDRKYFSHHFDNNLLDFRRYRVFGVNLETSDELRYLPKELGERA